MVGGKFITSISSNHFQFVILKFITKELSLSSGLFEQL